MPTERVDVELARIARLAGFALIENTPIYKRELPPHEGTERCIRITHHPNAHQIQLRLEPTIGAHGLDDHRVNSLGGAILFKVAMTLGERLGADVRQASLVGGCRDASGTPDILLASYPSNPLRFEGLCMGFRTVLLEGVGQEVQDAHRKEGQDDHN
jgi:hypothetical protein